MMKTPYPHSKNGKKAIKQAKKVEKNGLIKPIRKIDKNRVYAWVLLVLMVFWTFASVLSIMNAFGKDTKTISASAEEAAVNVDYDGMTIDPFQYPTANLLNWPYNNVNKNIDGVDVSTTEKGTFLLTGTCEKTKFTSYLVNNKNTYFIVGATYTMSVSTLSGSANFPQSVRFALACKFLDGSTKVLANVFLGQNSTFVVPDGALFFYIEFGLGWYEQVLTFDGLELGLMYNQGVTAYPYQPPYQLVYANGYNNGADSAYNSGYDAGVATAKNGFWNGCSISGTVNYVSAVNIKDQQSKDFTTAPQAFLYNGIDLSFLKDYVSGLIPKGYTFLSCSFYLTFSPTVLFDNFKLFGYGGGHVFGIPGDLKLFYLRTANGENLGVRFVPMPDYGAGAYGMQLQENDILQYANSSIARLDMFEINTLDGFTGIKLVSTYTGYAEGYQNGTQDTLNNFKNSQEYKDALKAAQNKGFEQGKIVGYDQGVQSANDYSFFSLLSAVVDAPLAMFKDMFNFDILGVNLSSFALGLLTLAMVLGVVKLIL